MLRTYITGTVETADTEQGVPHTLGATPDMVALTTRGVQASTPISATLGNQGNARALRQNTVDVYVETADTFFSVLAGIWQGRSY